MRRMRRVTTREIGFNRRYATKIGTNLIPAFNAGLNSYRRYASKDIVSGFLP